MAKYHVSIYTKERKTQWDTLVKASPEATFLFRRDFMEYHQHQFLDYSIMVFDNEVLLAVLPANRVGETVFSHQGLTYGGFVFKPDLSFIEIDDILSSVLEFLARHGIKSLDIKITPEFYQTENTRHIIRCLKNLNVERYRKDRIFAVNYAKPFTIHKTKMKHFNKNQDKGFLIEEVNDFGLFWTEVLIPRLAEKHNTTPVHTLSEIELLKARFKNEVKQFNIYLKDELLAGITIFDKGRIVKSQYGATTKLGEKERALEYLFLSLIFKFQTEGKHFFSMGTVRDTAKPLGYNKGLLRQKKELGCLEYNQDFYKITLA
ncbi:FemAB family protein [Winogradskyella aurantia]|uniref:FemAB family protein n=1 Tax=Winogradskyella aurantia TaxID=1915063 RepID=A0A265UUM1_9FLAO|nr:FemAB family protein [Winogradskyella aurantia]OZV69023.1 hypothetical protein CA834_06055 [Winogradskyella aurantia]